MVCYGAILLLLPSQSTQVAKRPFSQSQHTSKWICCLFTLVGGVSVLYTRSNRDWKKRRYLGS